MFADSLVALVTPMTADEALDLPAWQRLIEFHNSPGFSDESVAVYLATDLTPVADDRQGIEEQAMTIERVPFEQALEWIGQGRITDAKTIIGLQALALRRR